MSSPHSERPDLSLSQSIHAVLVENTIAHRMAAARAAVGLMKGLEVAGMKGGRTPSARSFFGFVVVL